MTTTLPALTEAEEAKLLVAWLRMKGLMFSHIPNETGGSPEAKRRAIRMKQQGTAKGFVDYIILVPSGCLAIELKRKRGSSISPEQRAWVAAFNATPGCAAEVCKGFEAAREFVEGYL